MANIHPSASEVYRTNQVPRKNDSWRFLLAWLLSRFIVPLFIYPWTKLLNRRKIIGLENLDTIQGESCLVCMNHTGTFDFIAGWEVGFHTIPHLFSRDYYLVGIGEEKRLGPPAIQRILIDTGFLPISRKAGMNQLTLHDLIRLFKQGRKKIFCLFYPEGTRSKNGRISKKYKSGAGWVQVQTGVPILPVYQWGYDRLPCLGRKLNIAIGQPMRFQKTENEQEPSKTWYQITGAVMEQLYEMEKRFNPEPDFAKLESDKTTSEP
jgi:1-acyl-sn-glycerol-3-phosphate acyltransferase